MAQIYGSANLPRPRGFWDLPFPSPVGGPLSRFLLLATMGLAMSLVAIVCVIVATAFFRSPYSVSFGMPGYSCSGDDLYLDSRTGELLRCADGNLVRAVGAATSQTPSPWTDAERNEVLALATRLGGGGLDYAERDQVDALADRIAEQHGYDPATGEALWSAVAYSGVLGFLLLGVGGIGVLLALRYDFG